jgi:hypothetical protein
VLRRRGAQAVPSCRWQTATERSLSRYRWILRGAVMSIWSAFGLSRAAVACVLVLAGLAGCNGATPPEGDGQVNSLPAMQPGPFMMGPDGLGSPGYRPFGDPAFGSGFP